MWTMVTMSLYIEEVNFEGCIELVFLIIQEQRNTKLSWTHYKTN